MKRSRFLLVVLFAAVLASGVAVAATAEESAPVPPGTTITMQNWQQYKQYLPQGLQLLFSGQTSWKVEPSYRMVIGETHHYRWLRYEKDTEKFANQVKIVALPSGGHSTTGYIAGLPFPSPSEPLKGWKVLVNNWYRPLPWEECEPAFHSNRRDRLGNENLTVASLSYRRFSYISDPKEPVTDPAAQGIYYSEYLEVLQPEQARYTAQLTLYYQDPAKPEDVFVFVPGLRRILRQSTAARCSPVVGSDFAQDDVHTGWNGGIVRWDAKFLRAGWVPSLVEVDSKVAGQRNNYDSALLPEPVVGKWEMRPVEIISVKRVPSQSAGYCYGERVMFVDGETWANLWSDLYDESNKYWKFQMINHPASDIPMVGHTTDSGKFIEMMWDFQNGHVTAVTSAAPNGDDIRVNEQCANYNGVNYTNATRWNTVQGLSQIVR